MGHCFIMPDSGRSDGGCILETCRFLAGDGEEADQNRHRMFKLIPSVVQGSWVIKQAVGNTPVLLGRKLATRYFKWASLVLLRSLRFRSIAKVLAKRMLKYIRISYC